MDPRVVAVVDPLVDGAALVRVGDDDRRIGLEGGHKHRGVFRTVGVDVVDGEVVIVDPQGDD